MNACTILRSEKQKRINKRIKIEASHNTMTHSSFHNKNDFKYSILIGCWPIPG